MRLTPSDQSVLDLHNTTMCPAPQILIDIAREQFKRVLWAQFWIAPVIVQIVMGLTDRKTFPAKPADNGLLLRPQ